MHERAVATRSSFVELSVVNGRHLVRDPRTGLATVFVFAFYLVVVFVLDATFADGAAQVDLVRLNLGTALGVGLMSIAFLGTAVPLVALRERGTLRLLGTTPVPRGLFLLSMLPVRVVLAAGEGLVVLVIAAAAGYTGGAGAGRLAVTMILGIAMLFALALLFAARARSAETAQQAMATLPLLLIAPGGGIIPVGLLPDAVQVVCNAIPTTWLIAALGVDLAGT
ncbi:ABC transporter permease [Cellulosimicrobium marinum]|uniref:ABC transporter permease n=1 Tax=Cellulosimicrobium marinum TaxID=1638992 RepID=UPI001E38725D|nr:ABC transporter permease [Cellulosimicrobium marinum]MCB7136946.1 ABC transporter permease [Cellulosimicrobium marinum]